MSVAAAPTIFDAFNARQLTPQQVATTFVPPPFFERLVKPTHTLIVGPRGSGKTTLLKMLHPAALEAWRHGRAQEFRRHVTYTGVFVATDINWNEQVKCLGDGRLDADSHRVFAKAAFTTQILHALIDSMLYRAGRVCGTNKGAEHRRVTLSEKDEERIARQIGSAWHIDRQIPSFEGTSLALARRLAHIHGLASQEALRTEQGRGDRLAAIEFLHIDFVSAAGVAVEAFNAKAKEHQAKWAFLFDELELAPQWVRALLVRSLRSVDERFLFKISLSPYSVDLKKELDAVDAPGAKQDFEPIRLWYVNKEHGYPFCRELLSSMLDARGLPSVEPEKIFGRSSFDTERRERRPGKTAYRAESELGKLFSGLANRDPTFRSYLKHRRVDLEKMELIDGAKRATDLRKVRSVVALRAYFKGPGAELAQGRQQARRSRKVPTVYGGATSLFAMVEANPRWFIGIVGTLLSMWPKKSVRKPAQVREVRDAANIFRAMLKTIPCGHVGGGRRGLLSLLDPVGTYFGHAAINAPFDPDPPCSFVVDAAATQEEVTALGMALNAGAIVYSPDEGDIGVMESVRGKRFRLSYILAPHYFVPLVLGRSLSLREVLNRADKEGVTPSYEPTLFTALEVES